MRLQCALVASVLFCFCTTPAPSQEQTISIDFGPNQTADDGWNNVTNHAGDGVVLEGARDDAGRETSVQVRQTDGWAGYNLKGHREAGPYPATAKGDSFYLEQGRDNQAKLQIEGLKPEGSYQLAIFASRMGAGEPRGGRYVIGEQSLELDATDNRDKTIMFRDVPADDRGVVRLVVECPEGQKYAYLGTLTISGAFAEAVEFKQPPDSLDGPPLVSAKAWAIGDGATGELLWSENEQTSRPMASTTKIMTAWIVLELARDDESVLKEVVTVSEQAAKTGGSSAKLNAGEKLAAADLLYGLMLPSGNDAAVALGEHFGRRFADEKAEPAEDLTAEQSLALFVEEMNRRAKELGMVQTKYLDPHGNSANRSSAGDLLRLVWASMQNEMFRQYVQTRRHRCTIATPDGEERAAAWKNTNQLLGIEGFDGVKTGTTGGAGACLVSSGHRGDDHLLVVVLGSTSKDGRYVDSRNLYRWAWTQRGHGGE